MTRHKVTTLFLDFEKEEKWLNEMSAKGLHFTSYSFPTHLFEEGKPGEYTYRLELLSHSPSHAEGKAYIAFMEETGVECMDTFWRWAYFRKKASDGPFELYTDYSSKIKHYQRIAALIGVTVALNATIGTYNAVRTGSAVLAIPSAAIAAVFTGLLLSYWKRIRKLKSTRKLHE